MTAVVAPSAADATARAAAQRRTLVTLVTAQILSGAGLAAGITVGALLAQDMLGSTSLAGLPSTLFTTGSALAAVGVGRLSQARGRRPGLTAGYLTGAVGGAGVVVAAIVGSPVLLFAALLVYGAGTATNLQARYAGADLAPAAHRARAVSTVLVATTLGGVLGPNLAAPTGDLADAIGIPTLAGPFLLGSVAYAAAALVLAVWLRPDPLLLARALEAQDGSSPLADGAATASAARAGPLLGAGLMAVTQVTMVAIMTMTPVFMRDHGHGTAASGLVIAIHVAAMYLPSPLTGRLVDRLGHRPVAGAAGVSLLAAGLLAALPTQSVAVLAIALTLLGLGWNFGLLAGTTIITDTVPLATRAATQGKVDVAISAAGATAGLTSGVVVSATGYPTLALAGAAIAFTLLVFIAAAPPLRR
ncbi:MFS transporter [Frankia sp. CNm7]|uniref:MFS transporter n=1 Tax=Frankia nepalensis TaxID=1836974 RepID=A0A937RCN0_9ACTN|nr:MFS transporter [Frankia nepalensis]MBL7499684.1 MFS transporter [Frankia nepalensis]MBL7515331.1 MFS transporter [Frankia nepalensis]MBL7517769.1 MFS transporter [Frankia nepalensis]MBL7626449.1 MFS transporter [Frankia nepalensis]